MLWISKKKQETIRENENITDDQDDGESIDIENIYSYLTGNQDENQQH